ncbi:glutaredoxin family protein [Pseudoxanthomonas koreensis]|uniref:glutaredoxin family protein n=1 Tax=Pseudoxanthomonas koreensis TaxID=266061 RepID=UPI0035A709FB
MRIFGFLLILGIAGGLYAWWSSGRPAQLHPDDPRMATGDKDIVMLVADWCGYCRKQQGDFERAGVRYRALDVDTDAGDRAMRAIGASGVPVTVAGQAVVIGYDTRALDRMLTPLGYDVY